ncbi:unnamed protein product [Kuraishia capsulata CBS 1993]|uniref:Uncharacterized protein n=1 Tax=Kuraishia capsulata CBS 1993 TaxID=1382522 RepID=W6MJH3_9ASCO|nr:uncharacterized protein KUCA_T00002094001 [Kuraishia capsulata CBS 1993]CDK26123.1 unnamed protein product [Kuraishia capsulata CBS 1993]
MVITTVLSFFTAPTSATYMRFYGYSLNATIFTYLVVLRQTYKAKPVSLVLSQYSSLIRDDNVQYIGLAILLRLSASVPGPVIGGLYPFSIYALFHVLRYIADLVPAVRPRVASVLALNDRAVYIAANAELLLCTSFALPLVKMFLLLGILRNPVYSIRQLVLIAGITVFLRFRYFQSKYTRTVVDGYDMRIAQLVCSPYAPNNAPYIYAAIKGVFTRALEPVRPALKKQ